ncbi:hypothetical protein GGD81_003839 [Rhodobium orientis]|uniref:Bacterial OB-fold domain-containing protein n=1 Tax=Rhodobium orientis TaxID=34017 RepID=A0A327JQ32_9HYPH|nr:DUF6152 family protein [Rhodobium orientis]MBB4304775.1 hypothetical protein [Rhodobium orientis]MBK5948050.1 hypothetical protein [Rhodobium orientis]RAI27484.1 hypothetical protein CH339_10365 [Rhodobium orientis]
MTRLWTMAALVGVMVFSAGNALAHHGWRWTTGDNIELTGIIRTVQLGNPHGVLTVDAEGEMWTVEVGQPWRNERAGLKDGDLAEGVEVRIVGEPSADMTKRLMKAEKIYLGDKEYLLYPDRD